MSPLLSVSGLTKSFGGVAALEPLELDVRPGEILGLIGENGAGKSTLIKLLSGIYRPDAGQIRWLDTPLRLSSPRDALQAGIATIHQELEYFPHLSVAENMLLDQRWPRRAWGGVDWVALHDQAQRRLAAFDLRIPTQQQFDQLSSAAKQEVMIATALSRDARLLILDEPTASLSQPEVERLFARLERLRQQGVTMIYVSHRLDEIRTITDRVAVLRDGRLVALHHTADTPVTQLIHDMIGRPLELVNPRTRKATSTQTLLQLTGATRNGMFHDVTFGIHGGEIVGLAGLVGAGRSEVARAIYGMYPLDRGTMRLGDKTWAPHCPAESLEQGLVYLPEERKRQGLVLRHGVDRAITIGLSKVFSRFGWISSRLERQHVADVLRRYDIRAASASQMVGTLSGGNQQKALLARWLQRDPEILLLDEPTRGVDIGAKSQIHAIIDHLAAAGKAVLLISSDLPELVGMSDRVVVMNRGTVCAQLRGDRLNEHNIILAASGLYDAEH